MRPNFTFRINLLLLFSFLIFNCSFLIATIRYVSKTGLSIPPYISWENAADSIQECINVCVFGDTIYVANGVYEEQVVMIPGLSLIGSGADSTIINTKELVDSNGFVAVEVNDSCLFKGFNIIVYYNNDKGWAIKCNGNNLSEFNRISMAGGGFRIYLNGTNSPIIYNNVISEVQFGVYIYNSSPIIRNNSIYPTENNLAPSMYGIWLQANTSNYSPIIDSNYIVAGSRCHGIYKSVGTRATIINNQIKLMSGTGGIFLHSAFSDSNYVFNNKIYSESSAEGIYSNGSMNLQLYNNYVTGNIGDAVTIRSSNVVKNNVVTKANKGIIFSGNGNVVFQYNNIWDNNINYTDLTPDSTNLSFDPMVVNDDTTQGELDFHLQMYSPLIDAGDPNILDKDSTRSDIGLYGGPYGESYIYVDLPPRPPINLTANVDSLIKLNWNKNTEADFSYYNVYSDTTLDFTVDSTKLVASVTDTFYYQTLPSNVETLYYKLTAVDNQRNESNPSEQVYVKLVTVKNEWVPVNNYFLYQNYPNPFNPNTKIGYKLKERGYVKLYVYDIKGELVSVLVNEVQEAGYYEVEFPIAQSASGGIPVLSSGVYIYQIFVKGENNIPVFIDIKKMVYVK